MKMLQIPLLTILCLFIFTNNSYGQIDNDIDLIYLNERMTDTTVSITEEEPKLTTLFLEKTPFFAVKKLLVYVVVFLGQITQNACFSLCDNSRSAAIS